MADLTDAKPGDRLRVRLGRWVLAPDSGDHTVCEIINGFVLTNSGLSFDIASGKDGAYTAEVATSTPERPDSCPVIPEGWRLVPEEPTETQLWAPVEAFGWCDESVQAAKRDPENELGDFATTYTAMVHKAPPVSLRTETEVRAAARRAAPEEAAEAAEACDSPFNCPSDEQYEAVDLMARRIADTIRALIDQT